MYIPKIFLLITSFIIFIMGGFFANKQTIIYQKPSYQATLALSKDLLIPLISLRISENSPEKNWTEALKNRLNGNSEVSVDRGRVDIVTKHYAIEIDFLKKWHEGLGQAIHYAFETKRKGVLALIIKSADLKPKQIKLIQKIEHICQQQGIKLILLNYASDSSTKERASSNSITGIPSFTANAN